MKFLANVDKDFILNLIYLLSFLFFVYKILAATLLQNFKKKLNPWDQSNTEKDFDKILRKRIDMLRASNGQYVPESSVLHSISRSTHQLENKLNNIPVQLKPLNDDLSWGNGEEIKKIIKIFQREFSYTPNEKALRDEVRKILKNPTIVNIINLCTKEEILNIIYTHLLFHYYVREIKNSSYSLIKKISLRLNASEKLMTYAIQYTLLHFSNSSEKFSGKNIILKLSEHEIEILIATFFSHNYLELKKNIHSLSEILREHFFIADFIRPWPTKNEINSREIAFEILRCHLKSNTDDIKRSYKKLAQEKHPDKIHALKLPKELEQKAMLQFQLIKQAYDLLIGKS